MAENQHITRLTELTDGLLYPGETGAPVEVVYLPGQSAPAPEQLQRLSASGPDAPVEEIPAARFLAPLTADHDWDDEGNKAAHALARELGHYLHLHCHNLRAYRVGQVETDLWLVGELPDGDAFALKTRVVET